MTIVESSCCTFLEDGPIAIKKKIVFTLAGSFQNGTPFITKYVSREFGRLSG